MRRGRFAVLAAVAATVLFVATGTAGAKPVTAGADHAVFVQTDSPAGNAIVAYVRGDDGSLSEAGSYPTGGLGAAAAGAVVDPLASQGGLGYVDAGSLLVAVNAGSDTVSVFAVDGASLSRRQILSSGGSFPASVAVSGSLVYVLNAGGAGSVQGFRAAGGHLHPIPGSDVSLGLANTTPPFFLDSPGQVGFSPDGRHLVVTTKSNGTIVVFGVRANGRLTQGVVNASAGPVSFAFVWDADGRLVVTEAGTSSVSTYDVEADGTLSVVDASVANGQAATCWIAEAGGFFYTGNAGSANVSGYAEDADGQLSLLDPSGISGTTGAGTIDLAATPDGSFLYVQSGGTSTISAFGVGADGTLTPIGTFAGPQPTGGVPFEGIVAS